MGQNVQFRFPRKLPGSLFALSAIQMVTSNRVQHSHPSGDCGPWLGNLPPSPAEHPELQLSASLCSTTLLGKKAFGVEGEKKDDPEVFTTTFSLRMSFAWQSSDFGNAGCEPSGGWEGRLWSS